MTDFSKMTVRCLTLLETGFDPVNLQTSRIFFVPVQALGCWNLVLFVCLAIPNCIMPVALELTLIGSGIEGPYMVVLTICFCNSMRYNIALCYIPQTHTVLYELIYSFPVNSSISISPWVSRNKVTKLRNSIRTGHNQTHLLLPPPPQLPQLCDLTLAISPPRTSSS